MPKLDLYFPNLKKLCLVILPLPEGTAKIEANIKNILKHGKKLELFQIVFSLDDDRNEDDNFCIKRIEIITKIIKNITSAMYSLHHSLNQKQQLLFKIYVKSCHDRKASKCHAYEGNTQHTLIASEFAMSVHQLILNFFVAFPLGKFQVKFAHNADTHYMIRHQLAQIKPKLTVLYRVVGNQKGRIYPNAAHVHGEIDRHHFGVISVSQKNLDTKNVHHQNEWIADCKWCCNTPWV